jgi:large subunit ribosomal protein L21e
MVKASKGFRRRTRSKLRKGPKHRGLSPITRSLQSFQNGEKACIKIDPSIHRGQPHPRFHGTTGVVVGARGRSYVLEIRVGGMLKKVIVYPAHLTKVGA